MTYYVLDTDAVIDYLKGIAESVAFIDRISSRGHILCTCDIIITEIYSGLNSGDRPVVEELLDALVFLPSTVEIARQAGFWRHQMARRGVALATADALIAATAWAWDAPLVTGNLRHYQVTGIAIEPLPRANR